jgi:hypothetical protein
MESWMRVGKSEKKKKRKNWTEKKNITSDWTF